MRHKKLGWARAGLVMGGLFSPLMAQIVVIPASDPVSLARAGVGVAFGQSLEAAGLNPALLSSLRGKFGFHVAGGLDLQNSQFTLLANQRVLFSSDSNRFLPAFGASWKLSDRATLGMVLDRPFARHNDLHSESSTRFLGKSIDLTATRLQAQFSLALTPKWSIGVGAGLAQVAFGNQVALRAAIPQDPTQPLGATNPSIGLAESDVRQEGKSLVPAWTIGARWAINPRWTLGAAVQGALTGTVKLGVVPNSTAPTFYDNDGLSQPPVGTTALGQTLLSRSHGVAGDGSFHLPLRAAIGVRQRVNQLLTWEFDLRYLDGASLKLPTLPGLNTPSGLVRAARPADQFSSGWGFGLAAEVTLSKRWTARIGLATSPELQPDSLVDPYIAGARSAEFSGGFGYKALGGEISLGYLYRQQRDADSTRLEGAWSLQGYRSVGTGSRTESMGHLMAIGYKRVF